MAKLAPFQLQQLVGAPQATVFYEERPSVPGRNGPPTPGWPSLPLAAAVVVLQRLPALALVAKETLGAFFWKGSEEVVDERS